MSGTHSLDSFVEAARRDVDEALDRWLPTRPAGPPRLAAAMRYSLFAGGKRFRPVLALAAADAVANAHEDARRLALPAACALEMIHTYSLIHDDLPAMDNDTLRRGRPTAHVVYGEGLAILAGDALLTEAFALLAREPAVDAPAVHGRKLRTIALVSSAAGSSGMVGGQVLDLALERRPPDEDDAASALADVHARKTGALIRAAAGAGALMAGAAEGALAAIDDYATELGLCFQIVDDVLDVEGAAKDLGKTAGKDAVAGKLTYPALYGLEESKRRARACVERAHATLAREGLAGRLPAIATWVLERKK
ncbi:MAG: polyprenyl synthetase family protein [Luteitalea sp.]|nr:polyprenyl synthetase family protein [Luteitalea sp.]